MMRLLLTRHAETKENADGIIQGLNHGNINKAGLKQLPQLIERLKKEKIDLIISSDILRAKKTAESISDQLNLPVAVSRLIREKDSGDFVGQKQNEADWASLGDDFENRKPQNGESLVEVRERARKFFQEILVKYKDKSILVVSHGAFLKVFIGWLLNMSLRDSIFRLKIGNCSLSEVEIEDKDSYRVIRTNNQDFLI